MRVADKTLALMIVLRPDEIRQMPDADRQRLAEQCRRIADIAEPPVARLPRTCGVLSDLRRGWRSE